MTEKACVDCGRTHQRDGDVCFRCHCASVSLGKGTTPSRDANKVYKHTTIQRMREHRANSNSWEKGIAIARRNPDGTVMPQLRADGMPMGVKEFADNRRRIEDQRQKVAVTGSLA